MEEMEGQDVILRFFWTGFKALFLGLPTLFRFIGWCGFAWASLCGAIVLWPVSAILVPALVIAAFKRRKKLWAYGSARFATTKDLAKEIRARKGLLLGRLWTHRKRPGPPVRIEPIHTAVYAPTNVGKSISFVIPHLLSSDESAVVIDFKGELADETAEHRAKKFGHKIVVLDPFEWLAKGFKS